MRLLRAGGRWIGDSGQGMVGPAGIEIGDFKSQGRSSTESPHAYTEVVAHSTTSCLNHSAGAILVVSLSSLTVLGSATQVEHTIRAATFRTRDYMQAQSDATISDLPPRPRSTNWSERAREMDEVLGQLKCVHLGNPRSLVDVPQSLLFSCRYGDSGHGLSRTDRISQIRL